MANSTARYAGLSKVLTAFVVLALLAAVFLLFTNSGKEKTIVADFKVANSLYVGNEVRVIGVPVGRIEKVEPKGDHVQVTLSYDGDVKLPADAKAVVVSPSIVGDRFVQLGPAYTGGAVLPDNATIGIDRTAVPVELDDIFKSIDNLALALGPEGANEDGSLSRLIKSTAGQLDGQGEQLAKTLENFGKLSASLDNNDDELFASVREVDEFVQLLHENDDEVRDFFDSTADVSEVLADEREELAATIDALSDALVSVRDFVRDNRTAIRGNVDNLEKLAALLANRSDEIDHVMAEAPTALVALGAAGGGPNGTLEARTDLVELVGGLLANPAGVICNILAPSVPLENGTCDALDELLGGLLGGLTGGASLPLSAPATTAAGGGGNAAAGAASDDPSNDPADGGVGSVIKDLAGLLAVNR